MKKLFVGIDVSKDVFDFCLLDEECQILGKKDCLPNSKKEINTFCNTLEGLSEYDIWICMEHTGHYSALLALEFSKRNIRFSFINPLEIKHSVGISRGKTDPVDAYRIAVFALTNFHRLMPYALPQEQLRKIKALNAIRRRYSKIKVQLKNGLKGLLTLNESINLKSQITDHKRLINQQEKAIKKIEKQILEIIKSSKELKENYDKITQVIGVGPVTAAKCIAETDNFIRFNDGRKFSCHCGLAPFQYKSGSSVRGRTKTSPLSNKDLKSSLFKAASTAIQHDPQLKNYYNKKLNEGKHKLSVLNAVANKIVLRMFAVVNRDEPFIKLSA